jgi:hypothetical protein
MAARARPAPAHGSWPDCGSRRNATSASVQLCPGGGGGPSRSLGQAGVVLSPITPRTVRQVQPHTRPLNPVRQRAVARFMGSLGDPPARRPAAPSARGPPVSLRAKRSNPPSAGARPSVPPLAGDCFVAALLAMTGLGATGLGATGLGATGLGATGLGATGLGATGLGATGLGATGLGATGVGATGLGATGLGATGLGATGLGATGLGATGLGATGLGATGLGATGLGATGLGATGLGATGLGGALARSWPAPAPAVRPVPVRRGTAARRWPATPAGAPDRRWHREGAYAIRAA